MQQKFAICNEVFGASQDSEAWRAVCDAVAGLGYEGIEIAAFTFAPSVAEITPEERRVLRATAKDAGLEIVGLHWLLAAPPGLHIHTRDEKARRKTVDYLRRLADFAGDLDARVLTFGSPAQRRLEDGDMQGAWERTQQSLQQALPAFAARGVLLCQESLPAPECDFIQTAAQARQMVEEINHPNYRLMLDAKSLSAEAEPPAALIEKFGGNIAHFHANDANRRGPGLGDTDFYPIRAALEDVEYSGYVAVEPFDYSPDPLTVARESLRYLREVWAVGDGQ
jgi:sugar phosphate isomerase/epimerase